MPHLLNNWKMLLKWSIAVLFGAAFVGFTAPEKGQSIELTGWLNARTSARFNRVDLNRLMALPPGTKGVIQQIQHFSQTKNYGLCLSVASKSSLNQGECVWVYYNVKDPALKLLTQNQTPAPTVESARQAVTTRPISGFVETPKAPAAKPTPASPAAADGFTGPAPIDTQAVMRATVANVENLNQNASQLMSTSNCPDGKCAPSLNAYGSCTAQNNYLENSLELLKNDPVMSQVLNSSGREILRTSCIKKGLEVFPNMSNGFRNCTGDRAGTGSIVKKACVSENYTTTVAKSFNAAAECLGSFVSGTEQNSNQAALSLFSLMSLESGLHINAVSQTGAGGVGQLTYDAIADVNSKLPALREHLAKSSNPLCSQALMKVLEKPMPAQRSLSCGRISVGEGNPLKNMLYTFAYQGSQRKYIQSRFFDTNVFRGLISDQLPAEEKQRLMMSLTVWSHNTGAGGLATPLRALFTQYLRQGKSLRSASDVTQLLKDLQRTMRTNPHPANARRTGETSGFFEGIQKRTATITPEVRSCLAQ